SHALRCGLFHGLLIDKFNCEFAIAGAGDIFAKSLFTRCEDFNSPAASRDCKPKRGRTVTNNKTNFACRALHPFADLAFFAFESARLTRFQFGNHAPNAVALAAFDYL